MQSGQSIDRAFQLLGEVADDPAGISELSRRLDLPTSTVARLLSTREGLGAVARLDSGTGYRIGPSVVTMAASIAPRASIAPKTEDSGLDFEDSGDAEAAPTPSAEAPEQEEEPEDGGGTGRKGIQAHAQPPAPPAMIR